MKKNFIGKTLSKLLIVSFVFGGLTMQPFAKTTVKSGKQLSNQTYEGRVDIKYTSLNAKIMGNGNISVVFDSGYGDGLYTYSEDPTIESWGKIQTEISQYAKTISYDRAGLGKSLDTENRLPLTDLERQALLNGEEISYDSSVFKKGYGKTAIDKVRDLHELLKASKVKAPYILVVHSIASLDAIEFTKLYPNEVAGIVMVEGSGINAISDIASYLKIYQPDILSLFLGQFVKADGTIDEILQSQQQANNAGDVLRHIPLTILSSEDEGMGSEYHTLRTLQGQVWLNASDYSKRIFVPNCGHYLHIDQPQYVIDAIKDMLTRIKNK